MLSKDHVILKLPPEPETISSPSSINAKCTNCGHHVSTTPIIKRKLISVLILQMHKLENEITAESELREM